MTHRTKVPLSGSAVYFYRRPDGTHGWTRHARNGVTTEGCNWLLETCFRALPQSSLIYAGLITEAGFVTQAVTDTHASHPGWSEWTAINVATRPTWTATPPTGGVIGTLAPASFTITTAGEIRGAFLSTVAAVGSVAAGVLYNTAIAISPMAVEVGGVLDVFFTVRIAQ